MLHKAACHPHKSENLVHAYWRYHSVERCTMRIKEVQETTLGYTKLQNTSLGGSSIDIYKLSAITQIQSKPFQCPTTNSKSTRKA